MALVDVRSLKKRDTIRYKGKTYRLTRPVEIDRQHSNVFTLYLTGGLQITSVLPCAVEKVYHAGP
jgi:hypothetical protein